ncbi:transposase [Peptoniphilaceae bacterium SGI.137]
MAFDAHRDLMKAIECDFSGVFWQRCEVCFMRNILAHVPSCDKSTFAVLRKATLASSR